VSAEDREAADRARFEAWLEHAEQSGDIPAIPAATVVVLRDTETGPQTLMLRRNSKIAFGGMWVFPGGRIDDEDYETAESVSGDSGGSAPGADVSGRDVPGGDAITPGGDAITPGGDVIAAARIAAVREAAEEAQVSLDAGSLVLFAHWIPPPIAPKRFATWFFAGQVHRDHAVIDDGEIVDMEWTTPAECLERHHNGEIELVPPTWVTLHTLRDFPTVGDALAALAVRPPRHHATKLGRGGPDQVVMWHGDAGYASGDVDTPGPRHRLTMAASGYVYEDSGAADG